MTLGRWIMMAARRVAYLGQSTATSVNSTLLTIPRPGVVVPGTLMLAFIGQSADGSISIAPAGWAAQAQSEGVSIWAKVAGEAEPASYEFKGVYARRSAAILAFGNAQVDAAGAVGIAASPTSAPSVTSTSNGGLALIFFASRSGGTSFTDPAGTTRLATLVSNLAAAIFSKSVTAGATGAISSTPGSSTARGVQIVLKPT